MNTILTIAALVVAYKLYHSKNGRKLRYTLDQEIDKMYGKSTKDYSPEKLKELKDRRLQEDAFFEAYFEE